MGGGGKGGSGGDTETTIRYAGYIETAHKALISLSTTEEARLLAKAVNGTVTPYSSLTLDSIDTAFFSTGYTIASFPSLWDMFGKFVAGLDVELLWEQIYDDTVNSPVTNAMITAESALLQDDIDNVSYPKMSAGYRDVNAVMSSSFITSKALIQAAKLKAVAKYSAEVKQHAMDIALQRWGRHLEWNNHVIEQYRLMNQLFWSAKFDHVTAASELATKHELWRFTVLDHHRQNVASLNGATTSSVKGQSTAARAISGGMGGAAMGAMVGSQIGTGNTGWGAAIGGALGIAGGLFS